MVDPKALAQANINIGNARVALLAAQQEYNDAQTVLQTLQAQDAVATATATLASLSAQQAQVGP